MKFAYSYQLRLADGAPIGSFWSYIVSATSTINRATFTRTVSIRRF